MKKTTLTTAWVITMILLSGISGLIAYGAAYHPGEGNHLRSAIRHLITDLRSEEEEGDAYWTVEAEGVKTVKR